MIRWIEQQSPYIQAFAAGVFTWLMTALGSSVVFIGRKVSDRGSASMFGFAAGVMLAASFWSLLAPGISLAEEQGQAGWLVALVGFAAGGLLIRSMDSLLPHLHHRRDLREGMPASWRRTTLLVSAITLHNVPEGLAIGVAFGAAASGELGSAATIGSALALALGIGIQNVPEGAAVSTALRSEGISRYRACMVGQFSAVVEPPAALVGAIAAFNLRPILPYALCFAAGAMVFVVVEELIPESQSSVQHHDAATMSTLAGFCLMMVLDVALG